MTSMNTSASPNIAAGKIMITPDIAQMVRDLRNEGNDCFQIARKLELTVPEVEEIIFGHKNQDTETLILWAAVHY